MLLKESLKSHLVAFAVFFVFVVLTLLLASLPTNLSNLPVAAAETTFNKDLELGDNDAEVLLLQIFLNTDPDTTVATEGPGSIGEETEYFGTLTRNAVIKFQNKYASEILTPVGLTQGTGYFGPSTRAKANSILANLDNASDPESADESDQDQREVSNSDISEKAHLIRRALGLRQNDLSLFTSSLINPQKGETITLYGSGFNYNQKAIVGINEVETEVLNNYEMNIEIPTNISDGMYPVYIEESSGGGNNLKYSETIDIFVGNNTLYAPTIDFVTYENDEIIVVGNNFDELNSIKTTLGTFRNIESKNSRNIVIPKELVLLSPFLDDLNGSTEMSFQVVVINQNGMSDLYTEEFMEIER